MKNNVQAGSGIASDTLQNVTTQYRGLSWR